MPNHTNDNKKNTDQRQTNMDDDKAKNATQAQRAAKAPQGAQDNARQPRDEDGQFTKSTGNKADQHKNR